MSSHSSHGAVDLGAVQAPGFEAGRKLSLVAAVVGLAGALGLAAVQEGGWRHLQFAWLFGTMFFVTLGFGGLFFVLLQYITRAGWSVVVRRIAEHVMSTLPMVTLLLLPLVILAMMGNGDLFTWANLDKIRDHHPEELHLYEHKAAYLNGTFFLIRFAIYVAIWMAMARYFKSGSLAQDQDGDPVRTLRMQRVAAPCTLLFALSITFAAVDFMMSLDAPWFSTIFGVYVFAGSFLAFMSFLGLMTQRFENKGYLRGLVTPEHYHDIGKLMFAFVFFWSYIAFSQFVLYWYADIPEETLWFRHRIEGPFKDVSLVLLFGHIFIPFLGLLSRHVKRNRFGLKFWAIWLLVMQAVDLFWLIMPNYDSHHLHWPVLELLCLLSAGGVFTFFFLGSAANHALTPVKDPRLAESLAFENI